MKKDSIFSKSETAIFIPKSITKQFPIKKKKAESFKPSALRPSVYKI